MRLIKLDTEKQTMTITLSNYLDREYEKDGREITLNYAEIETIKYVYDCDDDILTLNLKNGVKVVYDSFSAGRNSSHIDIDETFENVVDFITYLMKQELPAPVKKFVGKPTPKKQ